MSGTQGFSSKELVVTDYEILTDAPDAVGGVMARMQADPLRGDQFISITVNGNPGPPTPWGQTHTVAPAAPETGTGHYRRPPRSRGRRIGSGTTFMVGVPEGPGQSFDTLI